MDALHLFSSQQLCVRDCVCVCESEREREWALPVLFSFPQLSSLLPPVVGMGGALLPWRLKYILCFKKTNYTQIHTHFPVIYSSQGGETTVQLWICCCYVWVPRWSWFSQWDKVLMSSCVILRVFPSLWLNLLLNSVQNEWGRWGWIKRQRGNGYVKPQSDTPVQGQRSSCGELRTRARESWNSEK